MFGFRKALPTAAALIGEALPEAAEQQPPAQVAPTVTTTDPVDGLLRVIVITPVNPKIPMVPCEIEYMIHGEGFESFSGKQTFPLPTAKWPFPGDDVPVIFDRADPTRVTISWDQFMTHPDDLRLHDERLAQMWRDGGRVPPPVWPASGPSAPPGPDVASQLERLAKLRDDGVLSAAEFEAQKQKVLGA